GGWRRRGRSAAGPATTARRRPVRWRPRRPPAAAPEHGGAWADRCVHLARPGAGGARAGSWRDRAPTARTPRRVARRADRASFGRPRRRRARVRRAAGFGRALVGCAPRARRGARRSPNATAALARCDPSSLSSPDLVDAARLTLEQTPELFA